MRNRMFSFGGGVQSTAALVLATLKKLPFTTFVFSNVGDDSEHPAVKEYMDRYTIPLARRYGIRLEVRSNNGKTIFGEITKEGSSRELIPVRLSRTGMPGKRSCTKEFKLDVLHRFAIEELGATKEKPVTIGMGISLDEAQRMKDSPVKFARTVFPLVEMKVTRDDCIKIIRHAGLPPAPKSACWFCPFHTVGTWQTMKKEEPLLFERAVSFERFLNSRRKDRGLDPITLASRRKPLDVAFADPVLVEERNQICDEGTCFV